MNLHLLMQQPQDEAHDHRHDQTRRQWDEEREIIALDANGSRQVSQAQLREQGIVSEEVLSNSLSKS